MLTLIIFHLGYWKRWWLSRKVDGKLEEMRGREWWQACVPPPVPGWGLVSNAQFQNNDPFQFAQKMIKANRILKTRSHLLWIFDCWRMSFSLSKLSVELEERFGSMNLRSVFGLKKGAVNHVNPSCVLAESVMLMLKNLLQQVPASSHRNSYSASFFISLHNSLLVGELIIWY